ncbi:MAG: 2-oxoglutarate dehydrogenase E1 component, partial [Alphaproteobacteria bacterium]|nr:2-oxoglutarate dehydrogenase E1 component [Alphaproteobacteria bacterium]
LRRQVKAPWQKPLVVFTPKSLLRHKKCTSMLSDFGPETAFQPIILDDLPVQNVHKIILCTGKIYYDLLDYRQSNAILDVAIIRLEQMYPFPADHLIKILKTYQEIPLIWCQEEPKNMGAWPFLEKRLEHCLTQVRGSLSRPLYVGREEAASPATGYADRHSTEQETIIKQAFSVLNMKSHLA